MRQRNNEIFVQGLANLHESEQDIIRAVIMHTVKDLLDRDNLKYAALRIQDTTGVSYSQTGIKATLEDIIKLNELCNIPPVIS